MAAARADDELTRRVALIGFNAFAAAGCFVAGIFAAGVVPIPFVTVILGFVGLAYSSGERSGRAQQPTFRALHTEGFYREGSLATSVR